MEKITTEVLRQQIHDILKDADLTDMSSKKVRTQIEQNLNCTLLSRKKEIDNLVMDYVNSKANSDDSDDESDGSADEKQPAKRPAAAKNNSTAKKQKVESDDDASKDDDSDDEDFKSTRRSTARAGKKKPAEKSTKKPRAKKEAGEGGKGKGRGFTRPLKLSPALSELLGTEAAPRHEVVAKVWAIIKERNLYDPKNRQYAICDTELRKVMGIKRFRTFGMLKYLKNHFLE